ncbi:cupredoxin domain-containing protein [Tepidiforma sp.]|uniref:cupredoxin domain-containing protein n=1 Tax=Tepidiforma sp. TaxID=2682230 RepID=UPI002ADDCD46|nr:cupredoxin domain-containing protein [Tepidiforma sp.]
MHRIIRSPRLPLLAALTLTAALVLAACGGGGGSENSGVADGSDSRIPAGAPFIDQDRLQFIPTQLTVKVGETVYFKNSETALHTVNIDGKNVSGNMKKNDVFTWVFESAGTYKITCDYHPQMKATITVE